MTPEQQARREKRRAKEAPRRAAMEAARTSVLLEAGEGVSAHKRLQLEAWKADPGRDVTAFWKAKDRLQWGVVWRNAK